MQQQSAKNGSKWVVCRICLRAGQESMVNIFTANEENKDDELEDLVEKLELCGGIQLDRCADLPDEICTNCLLRLKVAYNFRKLCQSSQTELLEFTSEPTTTAEMDMEGPTELLVANKSESTSLQDAEAAKEGKPFDELVVEATFEENSVDEETSASKEIHANPDDFLEVTHFNEDTQELSNGSNQRYEILQQDENTVEFLVDSEYVETEDCETFEIILHESPQLKAECDVTPTKRRKSDQNDGHIKVRRKSNSKKVTKPKPKLKKPGDEPLICCHCGNMYNEKSKLTLHMKIHTKEKRHECEICHKRFAQTPQLARHMNSHTGNRPFKCQFCSARFADPSTCIKHQRIHTNDRPYKCPTCNKSFAYSNVLKVHLMTHTGEKPYSCEYCGKKFGQLHHKKAHERTHKEALSELKIAEEEFMHIKTE